MLEQNNQPHTGIEDLLNNQDLQQENIHTLSVPESIKQRWVSSELRVNERVIRYPRLQEDFSVDNFVLEAGDQFNAIAMRSAKPDGDFRIFQFSDYGYLGYNKPYKCGVSEQETLYRRHLRVGLVYRFEAVTFHRGIEGFIYCARPLALATGESATQTNFTKFSLMPNDRFLLKILNRDNRGRFPYGKFLSFACFLREGNLPDVNENILVEATLVNDKKACVKLIQKNIADQIYENNKKRVFRENKYLGII